MLKFRGLFSPETGQNKKFLLFLICLALAILTIVAFWSVKDCGFVNLDDSIYVFENDSVKSGLNADSLRQAFSFKLTSVGHWHPLTWLSLMLDHSLFGLNPSGFHLVNLLFHVINTLLLFLVLYRMTGEIWPCAFVACLFAIHPLHVESVAWVTERKDVLSSLFWMLTLGAYSYYVEKRGWQRYSLVLLFFALGLLAKPMVVTLPFVLLLLDFWPLRRFQAITPDNRIQAETLKPAATGKDQKKSKKKGPSKETPEGIKPAVPRYSWSLAYPLLREKIPFFLLIIPSGIATYLAAQNAGAVSTVEAIPLIVRVGNAFIAYITYIGKMIWPINLAVFYPYPQDMVLWQIPTAALLLIAVTAVVFWLMKKAPYLATGWLWYLGTLVPVIGIVQAGAQAMADRYTYISLIGIFIMIAWGVPDLLKKWPWREKLLIASAALIILCLAILTWKQVGYWRSSITLFNHCLQATEKNYLAHGNIAHALAEEGKHKEALSHCNNAIAIAPGALGYLCRANAYRKLGQDQLAIEDYNEAIRMKPDFAESYASRGGTYSNLGQDQLAIEDYSEALRLEPNFAEAYLGRGTAYGKLGQGETAMKDYDEAIRLKPRFAEAYLTRGNAYLKLGQDQQAVKDYSETIRLKPDFTEAYLARGNSYVKLGQNQAAIKDYNEAIRLKPDFAEAFAERGNAYSRLGQYPQAIADYNEAIRLKPDHAEAYNNRGAAYLIQGNKKTGCFDAQKACELGKCKILEMAKKKGDCR